MLFGEVLKNKTKENADNTLKNYRVLLRYCRVRFRQDKAIYPSLGYSESEYYRLLDRALLEFAEAYKAGELLEYRFLGDN